MPINSKYSSLRRTTNNSDKDWKKIILLTILVVWVLFSTGYIVYLKLNSIYKEKLNQAYNSGIGYSIQTLITELKKCKPVTVYNQEEQVDVISVDCLEKQQTNNNQNNLQVQSNDQEEEKKSEEEQSEN